MLAEEVGVGVAVGLGLVVAAVGAGVAVVVGAVVYRGLSKEVNPKSKRPRKAPSKTTVTITTPVICRNSGQVGQTVLRSSLTTPRK